MSDHVFAIALEGWLVLLHGGFELMALGLACFSYAVVGGSLDLVLIWKLWVFAFFLQLWGLLCSVLLLQILLICGWVAGRRAYG